MKTENLKKLAEIIVSENEENYDSHRIDDYYKVLDYEDTKQLDDMFYELDQTMDEDPWYITPSAQYLDIWAGEFAEVVKNHKPTEFHFENGKQIVHKYEEEYWTPFIEEHKEDIEGLVAFYCWNSDKFHNNLLTIFKDYVDMKKVANDVWRDAVDSETDEEVYEQLMNGKVIY